MPWRREERKGNVRRSCEPPWTRQQRVKCSTDISAGETTWGETVGGAMRKKEQGGRFMGGRRGFETRALAWRLEHSVVARGHTRAAGAEGRRNLDELWTSTKRENVHGGGGKGGGGTGGGCEGRGKRRSGAKARKAIQGATSPCWRSGGKRSEEATSNFDGAAMFEMQDHRERTVARHCRIHT